jgi:EpsI family protein
MRSLALAVPVLLAAQAVLVNVAAHGEHPPPMPDLARFPDAFGSWQKVAEDPIAADVQAQLHADRLLSRTYIDPRTGAAAGLFVAWFQSQRSGLSQPHSPQVCLPGSGWVPERTDDVVVGSIQANRYIVSNHGQRAVVLYWYQMQDRAIEGEWAAKFWTIASAVRAKRTDTALVRIVVQGAASDDRATAAAVSFGQALYPELMRALPR